MKKIAISYGFACWGCGKSVTSTKARKGVYFVGGQAHCSKACAEATQSRAKP